jgi:hypothetical protein
MELLCLFRFDFAPLNVTGPGDPVSHSRARDYHDPGQIRRWIVYYCTNLSASWQKPYSAFFTDKGFGKNTRPVL